MNQISITNSAMHSILGKLSMSSFFLVRKLRIAQSYSFSTADHDIPDIRLRALRSLLLRVKTGIFSLSDLKEAPYLVDKLRLLVSSGELSDDDGLRNDTVSLVQQLNPLAAFADEKPPKREHGILSGESLRVKQESLHIHSTIKEEQGTSTDTRSLWPFPWVNLVQEDEEKLIDLLFAFERAKSMLNFGHYESESYYVFLLHLVLQMIIQDFPIDVIMNFPLLLEYCMYPLNAKADSVAAKSSEEIHRNSLQADLDAHDEKKDDTRNLDEQVFHGTSPAPVSKDSIDTPSPIKSSTSVPYSSTTQLGVPSIGFLQASIAVLEAIFSKIHTYLDSERFRPKTDTLVQPRLLSSTTSCVHTSQPSDNAVTAGKSSSDSNTSRSPSHPGIEHCAVNFELYNVPESLTNESLCASAAKCIAQHESGRRTKDYVLRTHDSGPSQELSSTNLEYGLHTETGAALHGVTLSHVHKVLESTMSGSKATFLGSVPTYTPYGESLQSKDHLQSPGTVAFSYLNGKYYFRIQDVADAFPSMLDRQYNRRYIYPPQKAPDNIVLFPQAPRQGRFGSRSSNANAGAAVDVASSAYSAYETSAMLGGQLTSHGRSSSTLGSESKHSGLRSIASMFQSHTASLNSSSDRDSLHHRALHRHLGQTHATTSLLPERTSSNTATRRSQSFSNSEGIIDMAPAILAEPVSPVRLACLVLEKIFTVLRCPGAIPSVLRLVELTIPLTTFLPLISSPFDFDAYALALLENPTLLNKSDPTHPAMQRFWKDVSPHWFILFQRVLDSLVCSLVYIQARYHSNVLKPYIHSFNAMFTSDFVDDENSSLQEKSSSLSQLCVDQFTNFHSYPTLHSVLRHYFQLQMHFEQVLPSASPTQPIHTKGPTSPELEHIFRWMSQLFGSIDPGVCLDQNHYVERALLESCSDKDGGLHTGRMPAPSTDTVMDIDSSSALPLTKVLNLDSNTFSHSRRGCVAHSDIDSLASDVNQDIRRDIPAHFSMAQLLEEHRASLQAKGSADNHSSALSLATNAPSDTNTLRSGSVADNSNAHLTNAQESLYSMLQHRSTLSESRSDQSQGTIGNRDDVTKQVYGSPRIDDAHLGGTNSTRVGISLSGVEVANLFITRAGTSKSLRKLLLPQSLLTLLSTISFHDSLHQNDMKSLYNSSPPANVVGKSPISADDSYDMRDMNHVIQGEDVASTFPSLRTQLHTFLSALITSPLVRDIQSVRRYTGSIAKCIELASSLPLLPLQFQNESPSFAAPLRVNSPENNAVAGSQHASSALDPHIRNAWMAFARLTQLSKGLSLSPFELPQHLAVLLSIVPVNTQAEWKNFLHKYISLLLTFGSGLQKLMALVPSHIISAALQSPSVQGNLPFRQYCQAIHLQMEENTMDGGYLNLTEDTAISLLALAFSLPIFLHSLLTHPIPFIRESFLSLSSTLLTVLLQQQRAEVEAVVPLFLTSSFLSNILYSRSLDIDTPCRELTYTFLLRFMEYLLHCLHQQANVSTLAPFMGNVLNAWHEVMDIITKLRENAPNADIFPSIHPLVLTESEDGTFSYNAAPLRSIHGSTSALHHSESHLDTQRVEHILLHFRSILVQIQSSLEDYTSLRQLKRLQSNGSDMLQFPETAAGAPLPLIFRSLFSSNAATRQVASQLLVEQLQMDQVFRLKEYLAHSSQEETQKQVEINFTGASGNLYSIRLFEVDASQIPQLGVHAEHGAHTDFYSSLSNLTSISPVLQEIIASYEPPSRSRSPPDISSSLDPSAPTCDASLSLAGSLCRVWDEIPSTLRKDPTLYVAMHAGCVASNVYGQREESMGGGDETLADGDTLRGETSFDQFVELIGVNPNPQAVVELMRQWRHQKIQISYKADAVMTRTVTKNIKQLLKSNISFPIWSLVKPELTLMGAKYQWGNYTLEPKILSLELCSSTLAQSISLLHSTAPLSEQIQSSLSGLALLLFDSIQYCLDLLLRDWSSLAIPLRICELRCDDMNERKEYTVYRPGQVLPEEKKRSAAESMKEIYDEYFLPKVQGFLYLCVSCLEVITALIPNVRAEIMRSKTMLLLLLDMVYYPSDITLPYLPGVKLLHSSLFQDRVTKAPATAQLLALRILAKIVFSVDNIASAPIPSSLVNASAPSLTLESMTSVNCPLLPILLPHTSRKTLNALRPTFTPDKEDMDQSPMYRFTSSKDAKNRSNVCCATTVPLLTLAAVPFLRSLFYGTCCSVLPTIPLYLDYVPLYPSETERKYLQLSIFSQLSFPNLSSFSSEFPSSSSQSSQSLLRAYYCLSTIDSADSHEVLHSRLQILRDQLRNDPLTVTLLLHVDADALPAHTGMTPIDSKSSGESTHSRLHGSSKGKLPTDRSRRSGVQSVVQKRGMSTEKTGSSGEGGKQSHKFSPTSGPGKNRESSLTSNTDFEVILKRLPKYNIFQALHKYCCIRPNTMEDIETLASVLSFLNDLLSMHPVSPSDTALYQIVASLGVSHFLQFLVILPEEEHHWNALFEFYLSCTVASNMEGDSVAPSMGLADNVASASQLQRAQLLFDSMRYSPYITIPSHTNTPDSIQYTAKAKPTNSLGLFLSTIDLLRYQVMSLFAKLLQHCGAPTAFDNSVAYWHASLPAGLASIFSITILSQLLRDATAYILDPASTPPLRGASLGLVQQLLSPPWVSIFLRNCEAPSSTTTDSCTNTSPSDAPVTTAIPTASTLLLLEVTTTALLRVLVSSAHSHSFQNKSLTRGALLTLSALFTTLDQYTDTHHPTTSSTSPRTAPSFLLSHLTRYSLWSNPGGGSVSWLSRFLADREEDLRAATWRLLGVLFTSAEFLEHAWNDTTWVFSHTLSTLVRYATGTVCVTSDLYKEERELALDKSTKSMLQHTQGLFYRSLTADHIHLEHNAHMRKSEREVYLGTHGYRIYPDFPDSETPTVCAAVLFALKKFFCALPFTFSPSARVSHTMRSTLKFDPQASDRAEVGAANFNNEEDNASNEGGRISVYVRGKSRTQAAMIEFDVLNRMRYRFYELHKKVEEFGKDNSRLIVEGKGLIAFLEATAALEHSVVSYSSFVQKKYFLKNPESLIHTKLQHLFTLFNDPKVLPVLVQVALSHMPFPNLNPIQTVTNFSTPSIAKLGVIDEWVQTVTIVFHLFRVYLNTPDVSPTHANVPPDFVDFSASQQHMDSPVPIVSKDWRRRKIESSMPSILSSLFLTPSLSQVSSAVTILKQTACDILSSALEAWFSALDQYISMQQNDMSLQYPAKQSKSTLLAFTDPNVPPSINIFSNLSKPFPSGLLHPLYSFSTYFWKDRLHKHSVRLLSGLLGDNSQRHQRAAVVLAAESCTACGGEIKPPHMISENDHNVQKQEAVVTVEPAGATLSELEFAIPSISNVQFAPETPVCGVLGTALTSMCEPLLHLAFWQDAVFLSISSLVNPTPDTCSAASGAIQSAHASLQLVSRLFRSLQYQGNSPALHQHLSHIPWGSKNDIFQLGKFIPFFAQGFASLYTSFLVAPDIAYTRPELTVLGGPIQQEDLKLGPSYSLVTDAHQAKRKLGTKEVQAANAVKSNADPLGRAGKSTMELFLSQIRKTTQLWQTLGILSDRLSSLSTFQAFALSTGPKPHAKIFDPATMVSLFSRMLEGVPEKDEIFEFLYRSLFVQDLRNATLLEMLHILQSNAELSVPTLILPQSQEATQGAPMATDASMDRATDTSTSKSNVPTSRAKSMTSTATGNSLRCSTKLGTVGLAFADFLAVSLSPSTSDFPLPTDLSTSSTWKVELPDPQSPVYSFLERVCLHLYLSLQSAKTILFANQAPEVPAPHDLLRVLLALSDALSTLRLLTHLYLPQSSPFHSIQHVIGAENRIVHLVLRDLRLPDLTTLALEVTSSILHHAPFLPNSILWADLAVTLSKQTLYILSNSTFVSSTCVDDFALHIPTLVPGISQPHSDVSTFRNASRKMNPSIPRPSSSSTASTKKASASDENKKTSNARPTLTHAPTPSHIDILSKAFQGVSYTSASSLFLSHTTLAEKIGLPKRPHRGFYSGSVQSSLESVVFYDVLVSEALVFAHFILGCSLTNTMNKRTGHHTVTGGAGTRASVGLVHALLHPQLIESASHQNSLTDLRALIRSLHTDMFHSLLHSIKASSLCRSVLMSRGVLSFLPSALENILTRTCNRPKDVSSLPSTEISLYFQLLAFSALPSEATTCLSVQQIPGIFDAIQGALRLEIPENEYFDATGAPVLVAGYVLPVACQDTLYSMKVAAALVLANLASRKKSEEAWASRPELVQDCITAMQNSQPEVVTSICIAFRQLLEHSVRIRAYFASFGLLTTAKHVLNSTQENITAQSVQDKITGNKRPGSLLLQCIVENCQRIVDLMQ